MIKVDRISDGMERLLRHPDSLRADEELRSMCGMCESWYADEHDYNDCKDCQAFKFYCGFREHQFADSFY